MENVNKKHYPVIDIAKGIGIILVVVGHAVPDANTGIQNFFWGGVFRWIYSFHMALFMTMSGVLFYCKVVNCNTKQQKSLEIQSRARRLLLPYAFYSSFILLAKILFSSLSRKAISVWSIVGIFFGNSPCGNMWFLWTLFVISVIVVLVPHTSHFPALVIAISLVIYFFQGVSFGTIDIGIGKICNMLIWFSVGMMLGKNVGRLNELHNRSLWTKVAYPIFLFTLQILLLKYGANFWAHLIMKLLLATFGTAATIYTSNLIAETNGKVSQVLQYTGRNSMCIYVFSYFVQTPGVTIYRKIGSCGISYDVWVISLTFLALLFTGIVTKCVRKNRTFKLLLLGEK